MSRPHNRTLLYLGQTLLGLGVILAFAHSGRAQDLEPRAYSVSPIGTRFFVASYGKQSGSIVTDASLPLQDLHADVNTAAIGLGTTFSLFGKQALITAAIPYGWGTIDGKVFEQERSITRSGLGDTRVKLSVNLFNGKALTLKEFAARTPHTIIGTSLTVVVPTGQYDRQKLINLGTNRWAFKPEVGVSQPVGKWYLDAYAGMWFFGANDEFYPGGSRRTQAPLVSLQGHASYTFRQSLWAAFDATWYAGGSVRVNDGPSTARQSSTRLGGTFSFPLRKHQSIKVAYSNGVTARFGAKFNTLTVSYQLTWFGGR
ncbi:MAG: transporter [Vicinamibacterales bacterium]